MTPGTIATVGVTRYVTPLREGGSLPGLMEADDLGTYVVKFTGAGQGPKALVAEIVVGIVATVVIAVVLDQLLRLLGHVLTRWQRTGTGGQNPAVRRGDGRGTRAHEGGSRDEAGSLAAVESGGATA